MFDIFTEIIHYCRLKVYCIPKGIRPEPDIRGMGQGIKVTDVDMTAYATFPFTICFIPEVGIRSLIT